MAGFVLAAAVALVPGGASAQAHPGQPASTAAARIQRSVELAYPSLLTIYERIHTRPEVAFQERETAALLAAEMRKLGFEVTERVGKTGLVAVFSNGPGPRVLVRTEMDALPMEERTGLPFASRHQQEVDGKLTFVSHACGHDIHMAWWLGAARALVEQKADWSGTLIFIAQPAEETLAGAKAMIGDGLFSRWAKPDVGFAAHVAPLPAGQIIVKPGAMSAATDTAEIIFFGKGAHGSMPDKGIDPIVLAARFVSDVQAVVSREKDPAAFGVVTVGSFNAGTVANIIPDRAHLKLTIRSNSTAVQKVLVDGVRRTARAAAEMSGAPPPGIEMTSSATAVYNDPALSAQAGRILKAAFPDAATLLPEAAPPISPASEDFSEFVEAGVPSVFLVIGGSPPAAGGGSQPVNHSPDFAPLPQPTITRGAEALALMVLSVAGDRQSDPPSSSQH